MYKIILADCPWQYSDRKLYRKDNTEQKAKFGIGAEGNYSAGTMDNESLARFKEDILSVCDPDAYMFMWVTMPRLDTGLWLMDQWGFDYKTTAFVWIKTTKNNKIFAGPGAYSFSNAEIVLFGRRKGSKKCWHSNAKGCYKPHSVIMEPHPRDSLTGKIIHSRKPYNVHQELDKWLGPCLNSEEGRLELFATEEYGNGWTCLGHAISGNDLSIDLRELNDN